MSGPVSKGASARRSTPLRTGFAVLRSQALLELASAIGISQSDVPTRLHVHYPAIMHERSARRSIGLMAD